MLKADIADLEVLAAGFPSMCAHQIGQELRQFARQAPDDTVIVEVGSWLGAGSAWLSLGVRERPAPDTVAIHCFDRWRINAAEAVKAERKGFPELAEGTDSLPFVRRQLTPFGVALHFHQGEINAARWDGTPISVYVDDACKTPRQFRYVMRTFGPAFVPGSTVLVLMDFSHWTISGNPDHECQKDFIASHPNAFEPIPLHHSGTIAAFRYRGGVDFQAL